MQSWCPLGPARVSVVPPTALHSIQDEAWEAVRPQASSPLLVFVNSKSGKTESPHFLRPFHRKRLLVEITINFLKGENEIPVTCGDVSSRGISLVLINLTCILILSCSSNYALERFLINKKCQVENRADDSVSRVPLQFSNCFHYALKRRWRWP